MHHIHQFAFYISIVAITLGVLQMLPSIHIVYITKNKKHMSLITTCLGFFGALLWSFYGYMTQDFITIVSSAVSGALHVILLTLYVYL